jgi:type IV pilus assembly protein PilA
MQRVNGRLRSPAGFTLIELLVVIMVIALLAVIALPAFLDQRAKAQDSSAKSDARSMVQALESCRTHTAGYDACPDPPNQGIPLGTDPGQTELTVDTLTYEVTAYSHSGNSFTVERTGPEVTRTCSDVGNARAGCSGGDW